MSEMLRFDLFKGLVAPARRASIRTLGAIALGFCVFGCSFHARSPQDYRDATAALLETRAAQVKQCYDGILQSQKDASGTVVLNFTVEKKTGNITKLVVDEKKSKAPAELGQCLVKSLEGLALTPPDERDGIASFSYEFKVKKPAS
jgi:hypothetical protein